MYSSYVSMSWKKESLRRFVRYLKSIWIYQFWLGRHLNSIISSSGRIENMFSTNYDKCTKVMSCVCKYVWKLWHLFVNGCRWNKIEDFSYYFFSKIYLYRYVWDIIFSFYTIYFDVSLMFMHKLLSIEMKKIKHALSYLIYTSNGINRLK